MTKKLMESDQTFGYYLLKENAIGHLIHVIETAPSTDIRCQSISILDKILDSYSPHIDSDGNAESQRQIAKAILSADDILPRLLAVVNHQDMKTAGAMAHLLGELICDEEGTESWTYDADSVNPPPPCPSKEKVVKPELVDTAMGLLNEPDAAPGALHLLCQTCWGYASGFDLVRLGFEKHIPTASVSFLASLYGDYESRYSGRQRRRVADAAVQAGGIPRAFTLLEKETSSTESRQSAVEGLRVLLSADAADAEKNVARKSSLLEQSLVASLEDKMEESLEPVVWMLRLLDLSDDDKRSQDWICEWKMLGSPEIVRCILDILHSFPCDPDPEKKKYPDEHTLEAEAYEGAVRAWEKQLAVSKENCEK